VENALVVLDFHNCPDMRVCADQGDPNVTVDCVARTLRARTDAQGRMTFRVMGCAANLGASPGSVGPCLQVWWEDALLRVAAFDQHGCDGVGAGDLSAWLSDVFSTQAYARSDYNGNGALGADDLSRWLSAYFGRASAAGCGAATCP